MQMDRPTPFDRVPCPLLQGEVDFYVRMLLPFHIICGVGFPQTTMTMAAVSINRDVINYYITTSAILELAFYTPFILAEGDFPNCDQQS